VLIGFISGSRGISNFNFFFGLPGQDYLSSRAARVCFDGARFCGSLGICVKCIAWAVRGFLASGVLCPIFAQNTHKKFPVLFFGAFRYFKNLFSEE